VSQHLTCIAATALGVVLLASPARGVAQAPAAAPASDQTRSPGQPAPTTPARQANTWDWRHHQPTEAHVRQKENAAGIVPSPVQRQSSTGTVDHLDRQLLGTSHN
jgi:hypothetical protein